MKRRYVSCFVSLQVEYVWNRVFEKQGQWSNNRAGGRGLEKGTRPDYDVIMTSELKLEGYCSQAYAPTIVTFCGES